MKTGSQIIIIGLFLILLSIINLIVFPGHSIGLFIAMNALALMCIITGIFGNRTCYNMRVYFGLTGIILVGILILYFLQVFTLTFVDIIPFGVIILIIIALAYSFNHTPQNFSWIKEPLATELPGNYKRKIQLGYVSILLLFLSRALELVFNENFNTTIWGLLSVTLLLLAIPLMVYSVAWLIAKAMINSNVRIHFYVFLVLFNVWGWLFAITAIIWKI